VSKDEDNMANKSVLDEINLKDILADQLRNLKTVNPGASSIMTEKIRKGYFEEKQSKKALNSLADLLISTIEEQEDQNAN
jgi:FPC/CPF motif-containing protein YcgG